MDSISFLLPSRSASRRISPRMEFQDGMSELTLTRYVDRCRSADQEPRGLELPLEGSIRAGPKERPDSSSETLRDRIAYTYVSRSFFIFFALYERIYLCHQNWAIISKLPRLYPQMLTLLSWRSDNLPILFLGAFWKLVEIFFKSIR